MTMCRELKARMANDPHWVERVWFSDESNFYLSGTVNKSHCIYWGSSKPDMVIEKPLYSQKCIVWVAMSAQGIIGPFFLKTRQARQRQLIPRGIKMF